MFYTYYGVLNALLHHDFFLILNFHVVSGIAGRFLTIKIVIEFVTISDTLRKIPQLASLLYACKSGKNAKSRNKHISKILTIVFIESADLSFKRKGTKKVK